MVVAAVWVAVVLVVVARADARLEVGVHVGKAKLLWLGGVTSGLVGERPRSTGDRYRFEIEK